jgi:hypothetical protein
MPLGPDNDPVFEPIGGWTFGTTYPVANGSLANMTLGSRQYLIQRNWVNASGGYCATSY